MDKKISLEHTIRNILLGEGIADTASSSGAKNLQKTRDIIMKKTLSHGENNPLIAPITPIQNSPYTMLRRPAMALVPPQAPKEDGRESPKKVKSVSGVGSRTGSLASTAGGGKNSKAYTKEHTETLDEFEISDKPSVEKDAEEYVKKYFQDRAKKPTTPSEIKKAPLPTETTPEKIKQLGTVGRVARFLSRLSPWTALPAALLYSTPAGEGSELTPEVRKKIEDKKTKEKEKPVVLPPIEIPYAPKKTPGPKPQVAPAPVGPQVKPATEPQVAPAPVDPQVKPSTEPEKKQKTQVIAPPVVLPDTKTKTKTVPKTQEEPAPVGPKNRQKTKEAEPELKKPKLPSFSGSADQYMKFTPSKYTKPKTKRHIAKLHVKEQTESVPRNGYSSREEVEYVGRKDKTALRRQSEMKTKVIDESSTANVIKRVMKEKKITSVKDDGRPKDFGNVIVNPEMKRATLDVPE